MKTTDVLTEPVSLSADDIAENTLAEILKSPSFATMPLPELRRATLSAINANIQLENVSRNKEYHLTQFGKLPLDIVRDILLHRFNIANIKTKDSDPLKNTLTYVYQTTGSATGTYAEIHTALGSVLRELRPNMSPRDIESLLENIRDKAPVKFVSTDPDLIAVNNGVFNYKTKTLQPFSPDLVFLAKSRVDYVPNPSNPVIHNLEDGTDWDVESWFKSLSDDPEVVDLLWKITGAVIRPHVRWNKSPWLYSEKGNNGKGTFCAMLRNLCDHTASIALDEFSEPFILATVIGASAIITDENPTNTYIPKAAAFKAAVTHDPFVLNRKFEKPVMYCFNGLVIQCINSLPKTSDQTESLYRRLLFVPMTKCFTGRERKYIKDEYLHRDDVLQYVLHKVLHTNYYELPKPRASENLLKDYEEHNDPVRQFMNDILPECMWDLLPFTFLYDLYKAWFRENNPSGSLQGRNIFINQLINDLDDDDPFYCEDRHKRYVAAPLIKKPEPLIRRYSAVSMMPDPSVYSGSGNKALMPPLQPNTVYRGLLRKNHPTSAADVHN